MRGMQLECGYMAVLFDRTRWPRRDAALAVRQAWALSVTPEERWAWAAAHATAATDDDTPILMGSGGRRAHRDELLAFVEREQQRIARDA